MSHETDKHEEDAQSINLCQQQRFGRFQGSSVSQSSWNNAHGIALDFLRILLTIFDDGWWNTEI
jgi:hypothetical protein